MSEQKIVYSYKGYDYKSISLYKNPDKDIYHVIAGKEEHTTPFYFRNNRGWELMVGCY